MAVRYDDEVSKDKWVIFIVLCIVTMLDFGIIFAFGSMFVDMLEQFDTNRSSTAMVQSLLIGVSLGFSVVSGCLISKFGLLKVSLVAAAIVPFGFCISFFVTQIHYLYITISIIAGAGISTIHLVSIVLIERFFPARLHPICFAIQGISVNLAGVVYPLFIEQLLSRYTIHGTFLILGGLLLNGLTAPLMLMYEKDGLKEFGSAKTETDINGYISNETSLLEDADDLKKDDDDNCDVVETNACYNRCPFASLLTMPFMLLLLASAICIPPLNAFLGLIVDIIVWKDFTISQGMVAFVPFNICSCLSKLLPILTQKIKHLSTFVLPVTFCMFGIVSQLLMLITGSYAGILAGVSCTGIGLGGVFPAMLIVGVKLVDSEAWPLASGLLMTVIGLMSTVLGPVFGSRRDASGSYKEVVVIILIAQCVGIVLYSSAFVSRYLTRSRTTDRNKKPTFTQSGVTSLNNMLIHRNRVKL